LIDKTRIEFFAFGELLFGFLGLFHSFNEKDAVSEFKFDRSFEFFNTDLVHSIYDQSQTQDGFIELVGTTSTQPSSSSDFERAVFFFTSILVFFNVTSKQNGSVFISFVGVNKLEDESEMFQEIFTGFES